MRRLLSPSSLLLATGLTLLASAALHGRDLVLDLAPRLALVEGAAGVADAVLAIIAGPGPGPEAGLALIEPAAGPADGAAAPPLAGSTARDGTPWRIEALEAIAAELDRRRAALTAREQALALREAAVKLAEERLGEDVQVLEKGKAELEERLGALSRDGAARTAQLVKIYEAMKAKSAATVFETMEPDMLLPIVKGMRDTKVAAIVAEMTPEKARMLTAELARSRTGQGGAP
jgi:flagellar motility protein MotE (MotC chaperone)